MHDSDFRMAELFCGPGGIALAASESSANNASNGIVSVWANDYDPDTCLTYKKNILEKQGAPGVIVCGDVRKIKLSEIPEIDALSFGFPCNDFSIVGEQKGVDGDFGPLYTYGVKVLKLRKPKWFLAENVGGLKSANEGTAFATILRDLKKAGYKLYPHLYKFEDYGVPQARHRVIIVGIRNDQNLEFQIPEPSGLIRTAKEAIECPPIPQDALNNERTRQSATVVARLKHIKPGQNAFTAKLPSHLELNVRGAKISQIYKRLSPDKPAYTITGSGGGGTHVYHWKEDRALTNRERARLQTFPDWYEFCGSKESVRKQIGMAVPPDGARVIFEAILKTFAGIEYKSIKANINWEG